MDGVETFSGLLGWLTFVAAMIATVTVGCLLATMVQVASGAGSYGGRPIPGGVARRAEEVEARLRARYGPGARAAVVPAQLSELAGPTAEIDPGEIAPAPEPLAA